MYTRQGCGPCDEALELLRQYGFEPTLVEIDERPELVEAYGTCVPVITMNGKLRFRGRINETLLRRLLN